MIPHIASTSNPKIKWVKSLHKNSTRREENVFIVEGAKEIAYALEGGYIPKSMFICPELYGDELPEDTTDLYTISKECFEKISYRSSSDGLLAVFHAKKRKLEELTFGESPFFIIVESIEKPGNLGAIIRTADGAGADAVIVCDERTDVFNPNVIRSSVGTVFSKQVVTATNEEVFDFLENHEISAYAALLSKKSESYSKIDFTDPTAIVLGTEHEGLSKFWQERAKPIVIPMLGTNDSLNVSNAAAVLAYEVVRQRYEDTNLA